MPSIRNMARSTGPNAARTTGPAWSRSASSGWTARYSVPSSRISQPPAARTLRDQSEEFPNVSGGEK